MSSKLLKKGGNTSTSNSFNDTSASNSKQNNNLKRRRTLELEIEQTNLEMKLIKDKSDLVYF
ncbi:unnamed protein product [Meloidogyne enterolobii]|uniref:Uncharacterized protein n=1 Tax=Meloidogyne enterolobii TaxID=390850 RepID=A0ACB1AJH8_MELEN